MPNLLSYYISTLPLLTIFQYIACDVYLGWTVQQLSWYPLVLVSTYVIEFQRQWNERLYLAYCLQDVHMFYMLTYPLHLFRQYGQIFLVITFYLYSTIHYLVKTTHCQNKGQAAVHTCHLQYVGIGLI